MALIGWTFETGGRSVSPVNNDLIWEESEDQDLSMYIRRLTTELVFEGADYTWFYDNYEASGICDDLEFNISYNGNLINTGVLKMGSANTSFDYDRCIMRATIDPSGDHVCLQNNWDDEINILASTTKRTVQTAIGTLSELTCGPVSGAAPIQINGFFEQNVSGCLTAPIGSYTPIRYYIEETIPGVRYDHYCTWTTETITVNCSGGSPIEPPGDGWVLVTDNCPTDALYGRAPQRQYVGQLSGTSGKYWDNVYEVVGSDYSEISNGVLLSDIFNDKKPSCITSIVSDFFSINASGDAPSNDAYTAAAEQLQYLMVFQKSDVKRPDAGEDATVGEWTFKKLLLSLKAQFNVLWQMQGTILRVEHYSFWTRQNGLDLTSSNFLQYILGNRKYSYNGSIVPIKETFKSMETNSQEFTGSPITYLACITDDSEEDIVDFGDVNNDIAYIQANPDLIDDKGFVFVETHFDSPNYYLVSRYGALIGNELVLNAALSNPNIQENYYKWGRPAPSGVLNNASITFNSSKPRKKQDELQVPLSPTQFASLDAFNEIKAQFGWSEVDFLSYSASTCTLTVKLRH